MLGESGASLDPCDEDVVIRLYSLGLPWLYPFAPSLPPYSAVCRLNRDVTKEGGGPLVDWPLDESVPNGPSCMRARGYIISRNYGHCVLFNHGPFFFPMPCWETSGRGCAARLSRCVESFLFPERV